MTLALILTAAITALGGHTAPPETEVGSVVVGGWATWYQDPNKSGLYAAAGPLLRAGDWRGRRVEVCSGARCVTVALTDWCACGNRHGRPTVIDLSPAAFRRLAPLSRGVIEVQVLSGPGLPDPPPTDCVCAP